MMKLGIDGTDTEIFGISVSGGEGWCGGFIEEGGMMSFD
jgi:hypothetical protein